MESFSNMEKERHSSQSASLNTTGLNTDLPDWETAIVEAAGLELFSASKEDREVIFSSETGDLRRSRRRLSNSPIARTYPCDAHLLRSTGGADRRLDDSVARGRSHP